MKFRSFFEAGNIFQALLPFHYFAKAFGLAGYRLTKWGCDAYTSHLDSFILLANFFLWTIVVVLKIMTFWSAKPTKLILFKNSSFLRTIGDVAMSLQTCQAIFYILFSYFRRGHAQKVFQNFHEFDEKLKKENWPVQVKNSRLYLVVFVFYVALNITSVLVLRLITPYSLVEIGIFACQNLVSLIITGQFMLSVIAATSRMNVLYANMQQFLSVKHKTEFLSIHSMAMKKKLIKDVAMLYISISRAVREINLIYSLEMIPVYLISLIFKVVSVYYFLRSAMNPDLFFSWLIVYLLFIKTLAIIIPAILSIACAYYLISASQNFSSHIVEHAWATHSGSNELTAQMHLLFELTKLSPIKISCGLFDINLPLILSNIAIVGSYLVIICQFEITQQTQSTSGGE